MGRSTYTVKLHCEAGDHDWERLSVRGKRPRNCPDHGGGGAKYAIDTTGVSEFARDPEARTEEKVATADPVRAKELQAVSDELAGKYEALLDTTVELEGQEADRTWRRLDSLQSRLISVGKSLRVARGEAI